MKTTSAAPAGRRRPETGSSRSGRPGREPGRAPRDRRRESRGERDLGSAAARLLACSLLAAACGGERAEPRRELQATERPALDVRAIATSDGPYAIRVDDLYGSFEWEGGEVSSSGGPRGGWEFDASCEGWSIESGARPACEGGALRFRTSKRGRALVSQPGLGVRFRSIRAIEIKMSASDGERLTLSWSPDDQFKDRLSVTADLRTGPEPAVYTVKASSLKGYEGLTLNRLRLVPSDEAGAEVAVDWIRLVPREGLYNGKGRGLGREEIANESRHVVYARAPATFVVPVDLPPGAVLQVGAGVLDADPGVVFSVAVEGKGPAQTVLHEEILQDETWDDLQADLTPWGGRSVRLRFSVTSARAGSVALWANPTIHARGRPTRRPNVIVYLIDTLRADHVGLYGARRATTPTIDRLARSGAAFLRCTAQAPWTRPSVASILTSLYPPEHGDIDHGFAVSDGVLTLAEWFRRHGCLTAGFSASTHAGSSSNLDQGYDQFLEPPAILGSRTDLFDKRSSDYSRQTGEAINRRLLPWIERHKEEWFFAYVHSMDPHGPYLPAPPYDRMFDTGYRGTIDGSYDPATGFEAAKSAEEVAHIEALYDGDVRCNDDAIGTLVRELERLGLLENTVIVVTSDHGEEFRDHGRFQHGQSLHQELLHIPLVVHLPAGSRGDEAGARIEEPVEAVDIYPTLCSLAGLALPPDLRGRPLLGPLSGPSRAGGASAPGGAHGPLAVTYSATARPEPGGGAGASPRRSFGWREGSRGEEISVFDGRYKLIRKPGKKFLLYDLSTDPGEQTDLAARMRDRVEALSGAIETWWSERRRIVSVNDTGSIVIDQEERQWLEALGYLR